MLVLVPLSAYAVHIFFKYIIYIFLYLKDISQRSIKLANFIKLSDHIITTLHSIL